MSAPTSMALRWLRKSPARNPSDDPTISSSVTIEELHDASISRAAIRLVSIGLAGFILWANVAPVAEIATGSGAIVPIGQAQNIQHLEGGIVAEVLVREGDRVERGQPIIRLDDLASRAELAKATAREKGIRLEIERRAANRTDGNSVFSDALPLRGIVGSQQAAARADDALQKAQIAVAQAEVETRKADLSALSGRQTKSREELLILERQLASYEAALKAGAVSRNERDRVARDKIQLEGAILTLDGQRAAGEAGLAQSEAHVRELWAGFLQTAETAIADLEIEAANSRELVAQLRDRVARTVIVAPDTGRILGLAVHNPGQVVTPGEQIAQLIPEGQTALADVEIPADQIGFISPGMDANVKVLTFDYTRFGSIPAKVISISASSLKRDERSAPYFSVRLELDRDSIERSTQNRPIHPGMSVLADIKLGQKTVMSFLLKPLRSISDRALSQQ
ncbi:adhesin transport system membrane fusion protein [Hoeflea marina]|uniref:Membrane fusion protein (MFP) family protein n=1 Tax=Hoeflea marina TaxID=274592 RepID=A0A317PJ39_9HYPH|nr:HlyD family type I secretion periplasmic adaptor subunit [Hoeflea marina]PWW00619.1 adhesin transport system membrane fusion protein [Hoeflea marina]